MYPGQHLLEQCVCLSEDCTEHWQCHTKATAFRNDLHWQPGWKYTAPARTEVGRGC